MVWLHQDANLWDVTAAPTIVMTQRGARKDFQEMLRSRGVEVVQFDFLTPEAVAAYCQERGFLQVGPTLFSRHALAVEFLVSSVLSSMQKKCVFFVSGSLGVWWNAGSASHSSRGHPQSTGLHRSQAGAQSATHAAIAHVLSM